MWCDASDAAAVVARYSVRHSRAALVEVGWVLSPYMLTRSEKKNQELVLS